MEDQFKINHVSSHLSTRARTFRLAKRKNLFMFHGVQQKPMLTENTLTINGDIVKKDVLVVKIKLYLLGLAH